eukprot:scaffold141084_cov25-Prasinocladus_malaysianus.AAC.4
MEASDDRLSVPARSEASAHINTLPLSHQTNNKYSPVNIKIKCSTVASKHYNIFQVDQHTFAPLPGSETQFPNNLLRE